MASSVRTSMGFYVQEVEGVNPVNYKFKGPQ